MTTLSVINIVYFILILALSGYVIWQNPKRLLNRVTAFLFLSIAIWSFSKIFIHHFNIDQQAIQLYINIGSIGWIGYISFFLWFSVVFARRKKIYNNRLFIILITIIPLLFIIAQWRNQSIAQYVFDPQYGYKIQWTNSMWAFLFYAYFAMYTLFGLFIIARYARHTRALIRKRQSHIILLSTFIAVFPGVLTDIILTKTNIIAIPNLANMFAITLIIGLTYAIGRYDLLIPSTLLSVKDLIDTYIDAILILDFKGKIAAINHKVEELFGYPKEDLVGKPIYRFLEISLPLLYDNSRSLKEIAKQKKEQTIAVLVDSSEIPIEFTCMKVYGRNESIKGYVCYIRDITDQKKSEDKLKQALTKAEESDKLKTSFLANMSHEVRTPMNAIMGFLTLLSRPGLSEDKQQEFIKHINRGSESLLNLIDDIIETAKIESGQITIKPVKCDINALLKELLVVFRQEKQEKDKDHIKIILDVPTTGKFHITTSASRVQQILSKLLQNALKFTETGTIKFGYKILNNSTLQFYVSDTGIGIPKDKTEIIFDRFTKLEDDTAKLFGGTGLGLSIAKKLIHLLNGKIWVESEHGKGSCFYFTLPHSEKTTTNSQFIMTTPPDNQNFQWQNKVILIAEDVEINYVFLEEALLDTGVEILWAKNGVEAVDMCKKERVDMVLMDIKMPDMDGYTATNLIKEQNDDIVIIAQTAYAMPEDKDKFLESNCDDYITKPIKHKELLQIISKYLDN